LPCPDDQSRPEWGSIRRSLTRIQSRRAKPASVIASVLALIYAIFELLGATVRMLILFIIAAIAFRVVMLTVSIRNEKALRQNGAVEYGARNSRLLALAHIAYIAASIEGLARPASFDFVTIIGLVLYGFGAVMLLVVSHLLGRLWTVKLMIARDHVLITHPLFQWVPELLSQHPPGARWLRAYAARLFHSCGRPGDLRRAARHPHTPGGKGNERARPWLLIC
jgi:isoprenylcysteine carboxyl methyltransferase (ICMT) family protein YpbQ